MLLRSRRPKNNRRLHKKLKLKKLPGPIKKSRVNFPETWIWADKATEYVFVT